MGQPPLYVPRPVTAGVTDYKPPLYKVTDYKPPLHSLYICTYNSRSLLSHKRLLEFKQATSTINYDIIDLAEIRSTGYNIEEDEDHIFCYSDETKGQYGVGFPIKKNTSKDM
ncbi:hypothetical protein EVAR_16955_1 [Eumeta japonica]|uniref:Uncharacterized protein n=1 Tax=Eumeta variegata TaxID=151549 RepID=A0A4C1TVI5_EUMVA|nr:hypothetical protein EVAR_16955_1 [Eumeta japonica]